MSANSKVVLRASEKVGVLASGRVAVFNSDGLCPSCCCPCLPTTPDAYYSVYGTMTVTMSDSTTRTIDFEYFPDTDTMDIEIDGWTHGALSRTSDERLGDSTKQTLEFPINDSLGRFYIDSANDRFIAAPPDSYLQIAWDSSTCETTLTLNIPGGVWEEWYEECEKAQADILKDTYEDDTVYDTQDDAGTAADAWVADDWEDYVTNNLLGEDDVINCADPCLRGLNFPGGLDSFWDYNYADIIVVPNGSGYSFIVDTYADAWGTTGSQAYTDYTVSSTSISGVVTLVCPE